MVLSPRLLMAYAKAVLSYNQGTYDGRREKYNYDNRRKTGQDD